MTKQIRKIGSYEIVIYDPSDVRVKEYVVDVSLTEARDIAKTKVLELSTEENPYSYTVSRIFYNSKFSVHSPEGVKYT